MIVERLAMFRKRGRLFPFLVHLASFLFLGCGETAQEPREASRSSFEGAAKEFDPAHTGTIRGRVAWEGEIPIVAPFEVRPHPLAAEPLRYKQAHDNPNAPAIDPKGRGVANAVVRLRGVGPRRGRPWDHPPVRIEQRERRFHVIQGESAGRVGFVRRGVSVEMVSKDSLFHSLRTHGAAFFTLAFPDPDQPLSRPMNEKGIVELSSGAGYFWMRAYLFVDDHPYYAHTDAEGRFVLLNVPPGRYEVVCWMPNWIKMRHERDPETSMIARISFGPSVEQSMDLTLEAKETREVNFSMSASDFEH